MGSGKKEVWDGWIDKRRGGSEGERESGEERSLKERRSFLPSNMFHISVIK